jgi:hypothetical protein
MSPTPILRRKTDKQDSLPISIKSLCLLLLGRGFLFLFRNQVTIAGNANARWRCTTGNPISVAPGGAVTLSGGDLTAPRVVKTNGFGNYTFGDLTAG